MKQAEISFKIPVDNESKAIEIAEVLAMCLATLLKNE